MRALHICLITLCFLGLYAWAEQQQHALTQEELGSVHFATSCAPGVAASFNRAIALLHSFQYEAAEQAFTAVAAADPKCALAHWGVAMANYHGMWDNGDMDRGRVAINQALRLAADPRTTAREKAYVDALSQIYQQDGQPKAAHAQAFEARMAALQTVYPDDTEAAIFHALALAITAPKTDKTFANQRKCGEILEPIFQKQPHHPGVAHYIIHCYDNPVLAPRGLAAARAYARIAPASAHANHMPSHIFTRLGLWDESIASNLKSAALAEHDEQTSKTSEARDQRLHAMDYLGYAYLQGGRTREAEAVARQMNALAHITGLTLTGNYATAAVPARYVMELSQWKQASQLPVDKTGVPWAQAITWMAVGVGSARSGDVGRARQAEQALAALRDAAAPQDAYWSKQIEVQRREVAGWIAEQTGAHEQAVTGLRSAAGLEESMDKSPVTPGPVTPAREMLAQMFLLQKQPKQAQAEYEAVLKVAPNRFNALYGAAAAADAAGDEAAATNYFRKLAEIATTDERPEAVAARKRLSVAMK